MNMSELKIITSNEEVMSLIKSLRDKEFIALDTETTGITKSDEIIGYSVCASEEIAYYIVLAKWNNSIKSLEYLETKETAVEFFTSLKDKYIIGHNFLFDAMMIEANFKVRLIDSLHTDTMVLAHLLDENRPKGLKELGAIFFGETAKEEQAEMKASVTANGGTLTKSKYEMFKADAQLLGKYGAKDALLTFKLFYELIPELYEQELDKFFYEDETMPLLKGPTYDLNTTGLQVDVKGLASLQKQLEAECAEAKSYVLSEITTKIKDKYPGTNKKTSFNIGSSSQLSWLLFGELNLEFNTLTKEGKVVCKHLIGKLPYKVSDKNRFITECRNAKDSFYGDGPKPKKIKDPWGYIACDKTTLKKLSPKYKWIERLLEYQRKIKILSTYVEGIQERMKYGIINPKFNQAGTTSGRYSSTDPNFQNLPRDDKRIKQCIIARPGKVFVGADYSQLEPRVFAFTSQDTNLMEAFNGTDDFYSVIGMKVYGKTDCTPQKEGSPDAFGIKYKKLRDLSKVIALASTYGSTANLLSQTTGKSIEDTQADIDAYFTRFPNVAKMMTDAHKMAIKDGFVTNMFGRKRRIPEAVKIPKIYGTTKHSDLPYNARGLLNLAVNHRIQSTGASIVNRAAIRFHNVAKDNDIDCKLVVQVHDSLIVECLEKDAEDVVLLLQHCMEQTVILPGVPLEAVPKIGNNLADV
jgi:DNA polymerase I